MANASSVRRPRGSIKRMRIESQGLSHVGHCDDSRVAVRVRLVVRVSDAIVDFILQRLECAGFGFVANEHGIVAEFSL